MRIIPHDAVGNDEDARVLHAVSQATQCFLPCRLACRPVRVEVEHIAHVIDHCLGRVVNRSRGHVRQPSAPLFNQVTPHPHLASLDRVDRVQQVGAGITRRGVALAAVVRNRYLLFGRIGQKEISEGYERSSGEVLQLLEGGAQLSALPFDEVLELGRQPY